MVVLLAGVVRNAETEANRRKMLSLYFSSV